MNNIFEDNITALLTKHDNEQITLDQLKEIAKQMFDDTQYGETKNARVMLFSMMYAPHLKPGDSTKIAQAYQTGSTFGAEINKGVNLGMELRKLQNTISKDYLAQFKSLLEYFVSHLNYLQWRVGTEEYKSWRMYRKALATDKNTPLPQNAIKWPVPNNVEANDIQGFIKYLHNKITPDFVGFGQGWKEGKIQELVSAWDNYPYGQVCINVYGSSYRSDATYLHWKGTGHNISAIWDEDTDSVCGLKLVEFSDKGKVNTWTDQDVTYSIEELGLFEEEKPNSNIKDFYKRFVAMLNVDSQTKATQPLLTVESNNQFFHDVMRHIEGIDKFHAWKQYLSRHSCKNDGAHTINLKDGEHKITYLFLGGDDEIIMGEVRQKEFEAGRWFKESFDLNGERAFLSVSTPADCIYALDHFVRKSYNLRIIKNEDVWELWKAEDCPALDFGDNEPWQKIFFGTPGGGKSHKVKQIIEDEGATERCFRTTFHPDTDYASFVGSYKPVMDGKEITYQFIPQIFTNAYVAAWNDPTNDYYLVIEEINRGNCAQIFGDLFQLLDRNADGFSEYGIVADADLRKYLETAVDEDGNPILINKQGIHKGELLLPPNLSILATMNTSDQSLFPMDSAFKRRWAWEFVPSTYNEDDNYELTFGDKAYKWHDFLDAVNPRIKEATDSEDKQLGAYFIKSDMDAEEFKSKVMYYLWSEICKEEYKTRNNFFRHKVGDKPDVEFTFNELYTDGPEDATLLNEFMEYLKTGEQ